MLVAIISSVVNSSALIMDVDVFIVPVTSETTLDWKNEVDVGMLTELIISWSEVKKS